MIILGEEHRVVARNMAYDKERFGALLQAQQATPGRLRLESVTGALSGLVADMEAIQKEIYVVTDLQSADWGNTSAWLRDALRDLKSCLSGNCKNRR